MIWTDNENLKRQFDNMLNPDGKFCKNCNWGGGDKGKDFVTCGTHLQNFSANSFCDYWTDPKDEKLLSYFDKRKRELKEKISNKTDFAKWRDENFVLFLKRWEYKNDPEKGNWSDGELYEKFKARNNTN